VIEALMKKRDLDNLQEKPEIKMFLTDCDGCLTDGGMYYSEYGDELKKFNTRDGMGFRELRTRGIITGIITGENVELNRKRAQKLQLNELIAGCDDKVDAVKKLCEKYEISLENVVYVGDDINDVDVMKLVGLGCCPIDAMPQVKDVVKYIAKAKGGEGVIREIVDKFL
jgi:N-acylneuraminate cytidylyltransferase